MQITKVSELPNEAAYLCRAISDCSIDGPRSRYANFLERAGDRDRANAVRATISALHTFDMQALDNLSGTEDWLRMIGVPVIKAFIKGAVNFPRTDMLEFRDLVFSKLRPALSLTYETMPGTPPIGKSRLWGLPDLPENQAWPKISEVSNLYNAKDKLPQDSHCSFVGQFSFADFNGSVLGERLPENGGFSVFAITEDQELGIVETVLRTWNESQILTRRDAPIDLVQDKIAEGRNSPSHPHSIHLSESLSLPDTYGGVFKTEMPTCSDGPYAIMYEEMRHFCGIKTLGFGGYLMGTSGYDPSIDTNSRRLAILRVNPDYGLIHFAIPESEMKSGNLSRAEYVANDYDS